MLPRLPALAGLLLITGCAAMSEPPTQVTPAAPETYSLLGQPLYPALPSPAARESLEAQRAQAQLAHDLDPEDADAALWLGRRTAYLGRFRAAITIFSEGIARHPDDPRFLRHRGHRYLTLRRFDSAIADLEQAARMVEGKPDEIEPDGIPNARNLPTSTLDFNIWYHLGLARYLTGDFAGARRAYERCLAFSTRPDPLCATRYWLWQTLTRMGEADSAARALAPIRADLDVIENRDYLQLLRLYRGEATADTMLASARRRGGAALATVEYGVAGWRLARGEKPQAIALLREIVNGDAWPAFGHIAAEAELARLGEGSRPATAPEGRP